MDALKFEKMDFELFLKEDLLPVFIKPLRFFKIKLCSRDENIQKLS